MARMSATHKRAKALFMVIPRASLRVARRRQSAARHFVAVVAPGVLLGKTPDNLLNPTVHETGVLAGISAQRFGPLLGLQTPAVSCAHAPGENADGIELSGHFDGQRHRVGGSTEKVDPHPFALRRDLIGQSTERVAEPQVADDALDARKVRGHGLNTRRLSGLADDAAKHLFFRRPVENRDVALRFRKKPMREPDGKHA